MATQVANFKAYLDEVREYLRLHRCGLNTPDEDERFLRLALDVFPLALERAAGKGEEEEADIYHQLEILRSHLRGLAADLDDMDQTIAELIYR